MFFVCISLLGFLLFENGCAQELRRPKRAFLDSNDGSWTTYKPAKEIVLEANEDSNAILILDYGHNVAGFPSFDVKSTSGDGLVLESTYSETREAVDLFMGDGPFAMAAAMDSYRVNRYIVDESKQYQNRLIQGGLRYQKFNLSSAGTIALENIGILPPEPEQAVQGSFECSDEDLTRIWQMGVDTMQLSQISANTIPDFWEVTSEGALIDSLIPQNLPAAASLTSYDLKFDVKPIRGGFAFLVLGDTQNMGIYISANVIDGDITAHFGSTEMSPKLASAKLPSDIDIGSWHSVHTTVNLTNIDVSIDGSKVLNLTQTSSSFGSFGLGASYGHAAYYRNLEASELSGESIYSSALTDRTFLDDFFMGSNPNDTIIDGSKRDRIAFTGDLDVEIGASMASFRDSEEFVLGSIDLLDSYQTTSGFYIPTAKIQQAPLANPLQINITGLIGYSWTMILGIDQYFELSGNVTFAKERASSVKGMLDWSHSQVLPNGLFNLSDSTFGGDWDYYDPYQSGVVTKFNMLYAYSLQQSIPVLDAAGADTTEYWQRLEDLRAAINKQLWSNERGAYFMSNNITDGFAQDANALAILAGVTGMESNRSSKSLLDSMAKQLFTPVGPLAFSNETRDAGWNQTISPYTSSYHLRAALEAGDGSSALKMLKQLWSPMASPNHVNYTGCVWEALDAEGRPLFGATTSLAHGWGAGPTASLSRYVLGVQPAVPGFREWVVRPQTLGLKWARGSVPTPWGLIEVEWSVQDGRFRMVVKAPSTTKGKLVIPDDLGITEAESTARMEEMCEGNDRTIVEGESMMCEHTMSVDI